MLSSDSLLSLQEIPPDKSNNKKGQDNKPPPSDEYHILHFIFFFLSFGSIIPMSFFLTANDYWMFKFRDLSSLTNDARHRSTLQKNFLSTTYIIYSVPSVFVNILASLYGHKIHLRKRFLTTLSITTLFYLIYTAFIDVDTDSWQLGFFILTMSVSFLKSIVDALFQISNMALTSRFPPIYIKTGMYGGMTAMLFSSILQIFCLWLGGSPTHVARIYFYIGSIIAVMTLLVAYCTKYHSLFNYYVGDMEADTRKPLPTLAQIKIVYARTKPFILTHIFGSVTMGMTSSAVTTLIISENYEKGDPWTDKYFVPVMCFLMPGVFNMFGSILAKPVLTHKNVKWWVLASFIQSYCVIPLYMFCNSPKDHLPVLFPHDWQYITLQVVSAVGGGYLGAISYLSMQKFAGDASELAFLTLTTLYGLTSSILSPLTSVWVNIL